MVSWCHLMWIAVRWRTSKGTILRGQSERPNYRRIPDVDRSPCRFSNKKSFDHHVKKSWQQAFRNLAKYNSIAQVNSFHFEFLTSVHKTLSALSVSFWKIDSPTNSPCLAMERVKLFSLASWHMRVFPKTAVVSELRVNMFPVYKNVRIEEP